MCCDDVLDTTALQVHGEGFHASDGMIVCDKYAFVLHVLGDLTCF